MNATFFSGPNTTVWFATGPVKGTAPGFHWHYGSLQMALV